ncbi:hypothetical protein BDN71DRAFT_1434640 [Pleurotus eryngii]|uniref:Uncharacterized protein n=1 Tax=Pleurotus eryngii TaxID=5323 RepID=A0A9P5ZN93_PLEER|nr:hypothetical protein BDN71DRAFT_1434640 [Pleurotus eryngii]
MSNSDSSSPDDSDVYKPPRSRGKDKDSSELRSIQMRATSSSAPSSSVTIDHSNKVTSSSKRRTCRRKNILDFPSLAPGSMPDRVFPSPVGSLPVNIPLSSRLPDVDLTHLPTTSKTPFNSFLLASPTPSISSLTCAHSETPDDLDDRLFTRSARTLDLFVEDLELSLKCYHSVNFDARLLLKDYGFQEGTLHQCSPDFQAGLLAILGRWETPHMEGFWLPACPEVLTISHHGEDLFTFSHAYLLQLGHIVLALHQILNKLAVLKEDLKGLEGIPNSYLLQATWGVLMFCAKQARERLNNELRTLLVILGQHDERSIHSNDLTLSDVRREFLQNSPHTNVFQLLQRDDYRNGIPYSVQGPVKHWLQQLPALRPYVPARSYHSETEKSTVAPSVLPSITTPHPVQVHFASTPSSSSVYVPGYGAVEDSHGVGLSSEDEEGLEVVPGAIAEDRVATADGLEDLGEVQVTTEALEALLPLGGRLTLPSREVGTKEDSSLTGCISAEARNTGMNSQSNGFYAALAMLDSSILKKQKWSLWSAAEFLHDAPDHGELTFSANTLRLSESYLSESTPNSLASCTLGNMKGRKPLKMTRLPAPPTLANSLHSLSQLPSTTTSTPSLLIYTNSSTQKQNLRKL